MNIIKNFFSSILSVEPQERLKLLFLSLVYACIIGSYTITKDLRDTVFVSIVGTEYQPYAQMIAWAIFIIPLFFYAKLVDSLRRYQLLFVFALFYGVAGLIFAYLLGSPSIGLSNTQQSAYRVFGWLFYFFIEGYLPFVVSVFWAFANSISDQEAAKKNYGLMAAGSKVGGMVTALFSVVVLTWGKNLFKTSNDILLHQILLVTASLLSLCIPLIVLLLMKKVPGKYLHGYEAAYKVEKERSKKGIAETGIWAGLNMLIKYPYVLGMFGILFFDEVISRIIGFQRICVAQTQSTSLAGFSIFLFQTTFMFHCVGFIIAFFGTRKLIETLGETTCLMLVPAINFAVVLYPLISPSAFAIAIASIITKAVHYTLLYPLKESLYIPTVKEIKFKSKSWIDTFGQKFARSFGSGFNVLALKLGSGAFFPAHLAFVGIISSLWITTAYMMGKKYESAIAQNKVIGFEEETSPELTITDKVEK